MGLAVNTDIASHLLKWHANTTQASEVFLWHLPLAMDLEHIAPGSQQ